MRKGQGSLTGCYTTARRAVFRAPNHELGGEEFSDGQDERPGWRVAAADVGRASGRGVEPLFGVWGSGVRGSEAELIDGCG